MERLFLDANVLFSSAYRPDAGLLAFWKLQGAALCSSRYAVEEARANLTEPAQLRRLRKLEESLELFDAPALSAPQKINLPEKDRPILLAAIAARATHLVTGDFRHFGPYFGKRIEGVLIVTPADYLRSRKR